MNGADWLIAGAILLSVALAASQGLIYEVFSLGGVIIGYLLAVWWYSSAAAWFLPVVRTQALANVAGFITIFVGIVLLAGVVGRIARAGAKAAGLRWFDRVLGGAFGFIRGVLFVTVLLLGVTSWAPGSEWLERSQFAPYMLVMARAAVWVAPSEVRAQFREGMQQLRTFRGADKANKQ
jgi:membrane protein required for colicin V production